MKKISIITCFLICAVFTFAQDQSLANWQPLLSLDEAFTVETPIKLDFQEFGEEKINRRYSTQFKDTYFFIFVDGRKKGTLDEVWQYKNVLDFVANHQINGVKDKFGEYEAEKSEFVDSEGFHQKVLVIKTPKYIYIFQTTSQNAQDEISERFFNSIKIEGWFSKSENKEKTVTKEESIEKIADSSKTDTPPPPKVAVKDTGNGLSSSTTQNKALALFSKPRANYTDYARFYQIQGSVQLRVTFLANGTIGAVTPVTKLPFGLTNTAIAAAKQITFEPAKKDGVATTVVKQVIYSFTLY